MTRILIINSTLERSGLTNVILNICRFIDRSKFEVHILTLTPEPVNSSRADFAALGIGLHTLDLGRLSGVFQLKSRLREAVEKIKPDIIHTHSHRGTIYTLLYLNDYKWMVTIHGDLWRNHTDEYGKLLGSLMAWREHQAIGKSALKVAVSTTLMNIYSFLRNLVVIQNGSDEQEFYPAPAEQKRSLRRQLKLPEQGLIFISAGSLSNRKDPITVIRGFKKAALRDSFLVIAGKGTLDAECRSIARDANIYFTGAIGNIAEHYRASDFFISASLSEGLPNSVIEASLSGLRCILSDIPQHREVFEEAKEQATFFPVKDVATLASLITTSDQTPPLQRTHLTAKRMTALYEHYYTQLAEGIYATGKN